MVAAAALAVEAVAGSQSSTSIEVEIPCVTSAMSTFPLSVSLLGRTFGDTLAMDTSAPLGNRKTVPDSWVGAGGQWCSWPG